MQGWLSTDLGGETFALELQAQLPGLRKSARYHGFMGEEVDELIQETMLRALRYRDSYRPEYSMKAWLARILKNLGVSRYRKRRSENERISLLRQEEVFHASIDEGMSPAFRKVWFAVPENYREVLELVDIMDSTYQEAAEQLRIPVGTVMSRVYRGRKTLREMLNTPMAAAS